MDHGPVEAAERLRDLLREAAGGADKTATPAPNQKNAAKTEIPVKISSVGVVSLRLRGLRVCFSGGVTSPGNACSAFTCGVVEWNTGARNWLK